MFTFVILVDGLKYSNGDDFLLSPSQYDDSRSENEEEQTALWKADFFFGGSERNHSQRGSSGTPWWTEPQTESNDWPSRGSATGRKTHGPFPLFPDLAVRRLSKREAKGIAGDVGPYHPLSKHFWDATLSKFLFLLFSVCVSTTLLTLQFPHLCGYPLADERGRLIVRRAREGVFVVHAVTIITWIIWIQRVRIATLRVCW